MAKKSGKKTGRKTAGRKSPARKIQRRRRRRSRRQASGGVLDLVREARAMAGRALEGLRKEIGDVQQHLQELVASEESFRTHLFGGATPARRGRPAGAGKRAKARRPARRKGPTKADAFLEKLPKSFTLEDVRKVAGKHTGVSLAQWGRSKKVKKVGKGKYKKAA